LVLINILTHQKLIIKEDNKRSEVYGCQRGANKAQK